MSAPTVPLAIPPVKFYSGRDFEKIRSEVSSNISDVLGIYNRYVLHIPVRPNTNRFSSVEMLLHETESKDIQELSKRLTKLGRVHTLVDTEEGPMLSYVYKEIPIRVLRYTNFLRGYLSLGGIGDLMAIIAHSMGLKLTTKGLTIEVNGVEETISTAWEDARCIMLTNNYSSVLDQADLVNSTYFSKLPFLVGDFIPVSAISGVLGIAHEDFRQLVASMDSFTGVGPSAETIGKTLLNRLKKDYPHVVINLAKKIRDQQHETILIFKFSNQLLEEVTGFTGVELITFESSFKNSFKSIWEFELFVKASLPGTIRSKIKAFQDQSIPLAIPDVPVLETLPKATRVGEKDLPNYTQLPPVIVPSEGVVVYSTTF